MKKALSLLMVAIMLVLSLVSCGGDKYDTLTVAKDLEEKGYYVDIAINEEDIEDFADELNVSNKGVESVLYFEPEEDDYEKAGVMFFCESNKIAKALAKDLKDYAEKMTEDDYIYFKRALVKRSGNVIFFGYEDIWGEIK